MSHYISVRQAERLLPHKAVTIRGLLREGKLKGKKALGTWLVDRDDVLKKLGIPLCPKCGQLCSFGGSPCKPDGNPS